MTKRSKPVHKPGEWGKKFADLMRQEREQRNIKLAEYPKGGKYQEDVERAEKVPDLGYLLRLIVWYRQKRFAVPSEPRMRAILICWTLARLESWPESEDFREQFVTDYGDKPSGDKDKDAIKNEIDRVFALLWPQQGGPEAQAYFQNMLRSTFRQMMKHKAMQVERESHNRLPHLDRFPEDFEPLVVIVGDYSGKPQREPEHLSDLFRQAQSFSNLYYLLQLGLPENTQIVTDHHLLDLRSEKQRAEFLGDKHVLVIGRPLVNIVSRHLVQNKGLIFNFIFGKQTYQLGKNFYDDTIAGRKEEPTRRSVFDETESYGLLRNLLDVRSDQFEKISSGLSSDDKSRIEEIVLKIRTLLGDPEANHERVTEQFRPNNLFSPFEHLPIASSADTDHGYGLISLGENIWSKYKHGGKPKHALIMVSGTHELSTSIALRVLSEKETFVDYPLGGILEITAGSGLGPKRITGGKTKWLTRAHSARELLTKIDQVLENFRDRPIAYQLLFDTKQELEQYREMVTQYFDNTAGSSK